MRIADFDFDLPKKLIAQKPSVPRDHARMLVVARDGKVIDDGHFFDLPRYLGPGDVLVFNDSRVMPARLLFEYNGRQMQVFFLELIGNYWKVMVRPGKFFQLGQTVKVHGVDFKIEKIDDEGFRYLSCGLSQAGMMEYLYSYGAMPVPPYIDAGQSHDADYNTVYARRDGKSVAAPTAGLHFTPELLGRLRAKGVILEFVTLEVGLGTFLPVKASDTRYHHMHEEAYSIASDTAMRLNKYVEQRRRVIAVGTTAVRVLEDNYRRFDRFVAGDYRTSIMIEPGYRWRAISGLITNFHLPKSTLLLLVAAWIGKNKVLQLYRLAILRHRRFFSFGDGMLLL